jgi:hypothetical protein
MACNICGSTQQETPGYLEEMGELLTKSQRRKLENNFLKNKAIIQKGGTPIDLKPVVLFHLPDGDGIWLLTELNPENNIAFGLYDAGYWGPQIGQVDLEKLKALRGRHGSPVRRSSGFGAVRNLSEYVKRAREDGAILLPGF